MGYHSTEEPLIRAASQMLTMVTVPIYLLSQSKEALVHLSIHPKLPTPNLPSMPSVASWN